MKKSMTRIMVMFMVVVIMACVTVETQSVGKGMKTTIMVYSGQPNPTFTIIDKNTIAKIENLFKNLPKNDNFTGVTVSPSILGYTGILVENFSNSMADVESLLVYREDVEVKTKKPAANDKLKEFHIDQSLALQALLLQEALTQGVIDQALLDAINK